MTKHFGFVARNREVRSNAIPRQWTPHPDNSCYLGAAPESGATSPRGKFHFLYGTFLLL